VSSRRARPYGVIAAGLLQLLHCTPARAVADAPRVLLVYPAEAEPSVSTALVRVRGELVADGFEVLLVSAQPATSSAAAMAEAQSDSGSATVGLFLNADGTSAELWVVDKLTNKTVVRHLSTASEPTSQLSEVLAMRAVELLRASLLEFLVAKRHADANRPGAQGSNQVPIAPEVAERVSEWAARPIASEPAQPWTVETGLGVLGNPGQIDAALVFVGRLRFPTSRLVQPRLTFSGLGTRPRFSESSGSANVQQWYALAEVMLLPWSNWRVRPVVSLGAGIHNVTATGEASWPYQADHDSVWIFCVDAGAGVALKLSSRLALVSEGHATVSIPHPTLRFVGADATSIGYPAVLGTLTLAVSL
jgi:hypothetical protein